MVPAEAEVEAAEVAEAAEEVVVDAVSEELETIVKEMVKIKVRQAKVKVRVRGMVTPGTRRPGTPTCPHLSPVFAIGPMGNPLIFVWNQGHVPGRTSLSPSPTNEALTRSTIDKTTRSFMTCYITKNCQKYIP